MDARDRHAAIDYGHLAMHVAGVLLVIAAWVLVIWLVLSKPTSKLYEADNMVCASQPFAMQCWERKSR